MKSTYGVISQSVDHAVLIDKQMEELETRTKRSWNHGRSSMSCCKPFLELKAMTAASIMAEIGRIEPSPSGKHLSKWAGICPGNNRSAGKKEKQPDQGWEKVLLAARSRPAGRRRARRFDLPRKFHRWQGKWARPKRTLRSPTAAGVGFTRC